MTHKRLIEHELEGFGIRLNKQPPNITFRRKEKGGLNYVAAVPQTHDLDASAVKAILSEYKIHNADVTLRCDATADDLIDVIEGNRIYSTTERVQPLTITPLTLARNPPP